jgi:hypothetical protein
MATVSLHTHPGTGVIRFPFVTMLSKSASPLRLPSSILVIHTSIITVFSPIISAVRSFGTQVAITTISDSFVLSFRKSFFVLLLQLVTVA